jgi:serine/threonine protein kinase
MQWNWRDSLFRPKMEIVIKCRCGKGLRIPAEWSGRTAKCPSCGALWRDGKLAPTTLSPPNPNNDGESETVARSDPRAEDMLTATYRESAQADEASPQPSAETSTDADEHHETPRAIGGYAIEEVLGRGAHGVVYRAHPRHRPDTSVALKVVANRGRTDQLLLEPALLSQLDHPCIVGIHDYFLLGDDLILALDYVKGRDLNAELDGGRVFDESEVRELLIQLAISSSLPTKGETVSC